MVYASFPDAFAFPAYQVLTRNFPLFLLVFAICLMVYFSVSKPIKLALSSLFVALTIVFFVNSFILPINVGTLQLGHYIEAERLSMSPAIYIVEGLLLVILFLAVQKLLSGKYFKHVKIILGLLSAILIIQSILISTSNGEFFKKQNDLITLPNTISFSKKKENIIFILPDMFMGMHMKTILDESPELKAVFEGFTWYPNTLSVSTNTCPSISSLHAGSSHNLDILNQDRRRTMTEKITEASEIFRDKVKSEGYRLTSSQMVYSQIDKNTFDAYLPNWHSDWNKWNKTLNIGGSKELDFTILWKNALFYGAPLFIKPQIYKNGKWIKIEKETNQNTKLSQRCNFIRLLPLISDTLTTEKNFIYIHSEATHGPWYIVNDEGQLLMDVPSYDNQKWFIHKFALWIKWMKENGVYDNTKIVMLSDHSHYLHDDELNEFGGDYRWNEEGQKKLSSKDFWRVNAMLMVKEFKAKGELKEDWRLMSNSDAQAIVFDENSPTKADTSISRTLPVFFVDHGPRLTEKKNLEITKQFEVKDNIYNPNNWKQISK